MMSELFRVVSARRWTQCMVVVALDNNSWIHDLTGPLTVPVIVQYIHLRQRLDSIILNSASQDRLL
jgi:hypothetical protein